MSQSMGGSPLPMLFLPRVILYINVKYRLCSARELSEANVGHSLLEKL